MENTNAASELGVLLEYDHHPRAVGSLSLRRHDIVEFRWLEYVTDELTSNLNAKSKKNQLKKFQRNLVFVGLNNSAPSDGIFPSVFGEIRNNLTSIPYEIHEINTYWASNMSNLTNVTGICYFFYSLDREEPFYPLKVLWRSEEDKVEINI
jgi:hypothetical protein